MIALVLRRKIIDLQNFGGHRETLLIGSTAYENFDFVIYLQLRMEERERLVVVENMLTILHQHRIHSLSAIRHQVRMEEIHRLVVVQNMLTIHHQHRIHSLSAIRHQVRMEEMERLMVKGQNMLTILH
jgi:hypothetical protein